MPGPAGIIAGASLGSAAVGAYGANKGAETQAATAGQQLDLQREMFDRQVELLSPFRQGGLSGLEAYNYELGLGPKPSTYDGYTKAPGYDFRLEEGQNAVQAGVGARHGLNSGATLKALTEYGQNYATSEYDKHVNRLAGLADMGQSSSAMTASAANNFATGGSNALANLGNAQAAGAIGTSNAITGGINNGLGAWAYGKGNGFI